jgi:DNA invertase Pin-like site-specific DNA recombinase
MSGITVIFLIRHGEVSWERQYAACQSYIERRGYEVVATAHSEADVLGLLREADRVASVVIAAYDLPGDEHLQTAVAAAGGRLEYCRTPRHRPPPTEEPGRDTGEIVRLMASHGGTLDEIVRLLGIPLERVRSILRRQR